MRHLSKLILVAALFVVPATAQAGFIIEGSLGSGVQVKPTPIGRIPTNIMIAPGYGLGTLLRFELGLMGSLGDVENSKFDLQLRPMIVLSPPLIPLYARLTYAVMNLTDSDRRQQAFGGALGVDFELMDTVGIFAEVGVLPVKPKDVTDFVWLVEGRAGAYFAF